MLSLMILLHVEFQKKPGLMLITAVVLKNVLLHHSVQVPQLALFRAMFHHDDIDHCHGFLFGKE